MNVTSGDILIYKFLINIRTLEIVKIFDFFF